MFDYIALFIIIFLVYFWFDTISKREIAVKQGKKLAARFKLQLLDESVYCHKLELIRTEDNWPSIKRIYYFSVSTNNEDRLHCELTLIGKSLTHWYVPPYPHHS